MASLTRQSGFTIIEVALVVVVVAILGFVGYTAFKNFNAPKATVSTATTSAAPTAIKSKADVQQTLQSLNNDKSDQQLDPSQLDSDLSKLL